MSRARSVFRRLRQERGVALTELLVAMSLLIVVLGATLSPFEGFLRSTRKNEQQNEAQDRARLAIDRMARELRNVTGGQAVEVGAANDFVFQAVDSNSSPSGLNYANLRRVRYCLDSETPQRLWRQTHTWTSSAAPALPPTTTCPADAPWGPGVALAEDVVNGSRPLFTYDAATLPDIAAVRTHLFIDVDPQESPRETELRTGVYLRNRGKPPVNSFTATPGPGSILLDASASYDPEGGGLTYRWCLESGCDDTNKLGSGVTFTYTAPPGTYTIYLQVFDPGGILNEASKVVTIS